MSLKINDKLMTWLSLCCVCSKAEWTVGYCEFMCGKFDKFVLSLVQDDSVLKKSKTWLLNIFKDPFFN